MGHNHSGFVLFNSSFARLAESVDQPQQCRRGKKIHFLKELLMENSKPHLTLLSPPILTLAIFFFFLHLDTDRLVRSQATNQLFAGASYSVQIQSYYTFKQRHYMRLKPQHFMCMSKRIRFALGRVGVLGSCHPQGYM